MRYISAFPLNLAITFLAFLDTTLLVPIIALYASSIGAAVGKVGLIVGLYSITNTPASIIFGRLIDRKGYKVPLIIGLLGDALGMFAYSLTRLPVHLAIVRAFHGTAGGLAGPATMAITGEQGSQTRKGRTMAFYGISVATATLVGFGLSGILASRLGYSAVFYLGVAVLLIAALLALFLPKRRPSETQKIPLSEDIRRIKSLFRRRGLITSYCAIFAHYFTFGGVVTLLPLYMAKLGLEAFHVGMALAVFTIVFILLQLPSGHLSDRVGRKAPIITGLCLVIISVVTLPRLESFVVIAFIMAIYGAGFALLFPSACALVIDHSRIEERGTATGIFHALLTAGVGIGAPVIGYTAGIIGTEKGIALSASVAVLALAAILLPLKKG